VKPLIRQGWRGDGYLAIALRDEVFFLVTQRPMMLGSAAFVLMMARAGRLELPVVATSQF